MSQQRILIIRSIAELLDHAAAWDDLWNRSATTIPTVQATAIAQWLAQFGEGYRFLAVAVEEAGVFVAGLPLITKHRGGLVSVGEMPFNAWTPAGELLLDEELSTEETWALLINALNNVDCSWLWLDACVIDSARWMQFLLACEKAGFACDVQERFRIARTDLTGDWEAYRKTWSRNHRRNVTRHRRQLEADYGQVRLRLEAPTNPQQLAALLRHGFEIEDRSWKGAAGTSILRSPGMWAYYLRQAELLAARDQLLLAFLEVDQQPIAFQYGWSAKGVYHPFKIGYDERYHAYGPGQLLIHDLLEHFFHTRSQRTFDFIGPLSAASSKWQTSRYTIGRIVVAPRQMFGQAMIYAYRHLWPTLKRWRIGSKNEACWAATEACEEHINA